MAFTPPAVLRSPLRMHQAGHDGTWELWTINPGALAKQGRTKQPSSRPLHYAGGKLESEVGGLQGLPRRFVSAAPLFAFPVLT